MKKIIVIGHLGRDPGMRYTPNGQGVTNFSVASSGKYTPESGGDALREKKSAPVRNRGARWFGSLEPQPPAILFRFSRV